VLAVPLAIKAEQPVKVVRIGWLGGASPGEGQNFILEFRWAHGMTEQLPHLAAEFVRRKVDFIIVASSPSALAAIHATSIIPIVMVSGGVDPVGQGLVASLARPGGNVTGLVLFRGAEVAGKYLEIFKEAVSRLSHVAVLWNPGNQGHAVLLREMERAISSWPCEHPFAPDASAAVPLMLRHAIRPSQLLRADQVLE